jgi:beta-alanine--pyruvate transaminase
LERSAFSRGLPEEGVEYADDLQRLVDLHGADTIAAVIVEPVGGAGGVLLPPEGYLQRLRDICSENGILLIFDEVITGFGRLGASCAAQRFGVTPDMITAAKGITNATVPMGAVFVNDTIYEAFMGMDESGIELSHGYTYSGHPLACAAGMATLDIYEQENLFPRAATLNDHWMDSALGLSGLEKVIDIRCFALLAAIEIEPRADAAMQRGTEAAKICYENGIWVRNIGDVLVLSPPLIITEAEISHIFEVIGQAIEQTA